jgi:hypothetical protein
MPRQLSHLWIVVKGYTSTCFRTALRDRLFLQRFQLRMATNAVVAGG